MASNIALRSELKMSFHDYVCSLFAKMLPLCMEGLRPKRARFHEPDYVAGIVKNIPSKLSGVLPSGLSIGGCYVHKSPLVAFSHEEDVKSCEAGDLLVLYRERVGDRERFNSVLFQFKRSDVDRIDNIQYVLYSHWPKFNFGRKIYADREKYDVTPKASHAGALYNYIHTGVDLYFTISDPHEFVIDGGIDVRNGTRFEKFLGDFISWRTGKEISSHAKHIEGKDDDEWSRLIWTIYDKTFEVAFSRANIAVKNRPRGFGDRMRFLQSEDATAEFVVGAAPGDKFGSGEAESDGACSVLIIDNCMELKPCFVV